MSFRVLFLCLILAVRLSPAQNPISLAETFSNRALCSCDTGIAVALGSQLLILDPVDTDELRVLGRLRLDAQVESLVGRGNTVYAGLRNGTLCVIDAEDPADPQVAFCQTTAATPLSMHAAGDLLALAEGEGGLEFYDVSQALSPLLLAQVLTPSPAYSVALSDTLAIGGLDDDVILYDLRSPASPLALSGHALPSPALAQVLDGTRALLACGSQGLRILDFADPLAPSLGPPTTYGPYVHTVALRDSLLLVAGIDYVDLHRLDPLLRRLDHWPSLWGTHGGVLTEEACWLAQGENGLQVLALSDTDTLSAAAQLALPDWAGSLARQEDRLAILDPLIGLYSMDLQDPGFPLPTAPYLHPGTIRAFCLNEQGACLARAEGLEWINFDPQLPPTQEESWAIPCEVRHLHAAGEFTLAACTDGLLKVIRRDPEPAVVDQLPTPQNASALGALGEHTFLADHSGGLRLLSVDDSGGIQVLGEYTEPGGIQAATAAGSLLGLAGGAPARLLLLEWMGSFFVDRGEVALEDSVLSLGLGEETLWVLSHDGVLSVYDIQAPGLITFLASTLVDPQSESILAVDDRIYIGEAQRGLRAYVYNPETGIRREKAFRPQGMELLPPWPNPFNGRLNYNIQLQAAGPVRLRLFDLRGARVLERKLGRLVPGSHTGTLELQGQSGGLYFLQLETAAGFSTRKVSYIP